jgi:membrane associated rhomboid family serine protease
MNSNQNSISNDFNPNQMCKDCRDGLNSILENMPLFIKIIVFTTFIFFLINLFIPYVALFLANIPYFTIFGFQIWRLFTTAFITTGLLSIIFSLLFWYRDAVQLERENGTIKYMLTFFMFNFFIQILYCLITLIISTIIQNPILLRTKITPRGVRNEGLWPILMCDLTLLCLNNPEANMRFFFFPCNIKAKYYPLVLFAIFTILSGFIIDFEILCGIGFGFLYHYYLRNKLEISDTFALRVENSSFGQFLANKKGFISINNTGSSDIPMNMENVTNSTPSRGFTAFKGKGIAVGSSDNSTNQQNVDYSNLSTRATEETNPTNSKLEVDNSDTPV